MTKYLLIAPLTLSAASLTAKPASQPNVIIIFTDDQGYGDLSCYGSTKVSTPNIDRLAENGLRLTNFYVSSSVSSASRAGLLTGRLNTRNGVPKVYFPNNPGMPASEITLAEQLKTAGYTTACLGKWHLGDLDGSLPADQGFDYYFGIPYSNDMYIGPTHKLSKNINLRLGFTREMVKASQEFSGSRASIVEKRDRDNFGVPLFENKEVIEYPCDQATTTERYIDQAINFIDQNKGEKPFFVYITPSMPHYPISVTDKFKGSSGEGLYSDAVQEIDYNVGRLVDYLTAEGLDKNTIIIYSSDNGPWLGKGESSGTAGEFRDGKFSLYEGGVRVPFIVSCPGLVAKGELSDQMMASIDLFPTIMHYAGQDEFEQKIDGFNQASFLKKPKKGSLRDEYLYIRESKIEGIRKGNWVYLRYSGKAHKRGDFAELFNLNDDISEAKNLFSTHPEKVAELEDIIQSYE